MKEKDSLKHNVGAADPRDPNHAKYVRNLRSTDLLMRQFLKLESGLGNSEAFRESPLWCKCGRMNSAGDEHARTCPDNAPERFEDVGTGT